ncbi:hypothetical protein ACJX0J_014981, partial [Zea mays]
MTVSHFHYSLILFMVLVDLIAFGTWLKNFPYTFIDVLENKIKSARLGTRLDCHKQKGWSMEDIIIVV